MKSQSTCFVVPLDDNIQIFSVGFQVEPTDKHYDTDLRNTAKFSMFDSLNLTEYDSL
jgi:hypothetical protein